MHQFFVEFAVIYSVWNVFVRMRTFSKSVISGLIYMLTICEAFLRLIAFLSDFDYGSAVEMVTADSVSTIVMIILFINILGEIMTFVLLEINLLLFDVDCFLIKKAEKQYLPCLTKPGIDVEEIWKSSGFI